MVKVFKKGRKPSKSLERKLKRLANLTVSEVEKSPEDLEVLRRYNLLRSRRSLIMDFERLAARTPKHVSSWIKHPGKYDIPHVDTPNSPYSEVVEEVAERLRKNRVKGRGKSVKGFEIQLPEDIASSLINEALESTYKYAHGTVKLLIGDVLNNVFKAYPFSPYGGSMLVFDSRKGFLVGGIAEDKSFGFLVTGGKDNVTGSASPLVASVTLTDALTGLKGKELREGLINVKTVNGVPQVCNESYCLDTEFLPKKDVEDVTDKLTNLIKLFNDMPSLRIELSADDVKKLRKLVSKVRGGYVKVTKDGIKVLDEEMGVIGKVEPARVEGADTGSMVYARNLKPLLPKDTGVTLTVLKTVEGGLINPLKVSFTYGDVTADFFMSPVAIYNVDVKKEVKGERINLSHDVIKAIENLYSVAPFAGSAYLGDRGLVVVDDSYFPTFALLKEFSKPLGLNGKIIWIDLSRYALGKVKAFLEHVKGKDVDLVINKDGAYLSVPNEGFIKLGYTANDFGGFIRDATSNLSKLKRDLGISKWVKVDYRKVAKALESKPPEDVRKGFIELNVNNDSFKINDENIIEKIGGEEDLGSYGIVLSRKTLRAFHSMGECRDVGFAFHHDAVFMKCGDTYLLVTSDFYPYR